MGWFTRLGALVTALLTTLAMAVLAPATAWAGVLDEAARARPRVRGFGLLGALCCLVVVAVVVVAVLLLARTRRRR